MASLLDIKPNRTKSIEVGGEKLPVRGIASEDIANLLEHFPELQNAFANKQVGSILDLLKFAPAAMAKVIAIATVQKGEDLAAIESHAKTLLIGDQIEIIQASFELTFPKGAGPLLESLRRAGLAGGGSKNEDKTSDASVDTGKGVDTKSPSPSPKSSS